MVNVRRALENRELVVSRDVIVPSIREKGQTTRLVTVPSDELEGLRVDQATDLTIMIKDADWRITRKPDSTAYHFVRPSGNSYDPRASAETSTLTALQRFYDFLTLI